MTQKCTFFYFSYGDRFFPSTLRGPISKKPLNIDLHELDLRRRVRSQFENLNEF